MTLSTSTGLSQEAGEPSCFSDLPIPLPPPGTNTQQAQSVQHGAVDTLGSAPGEKLAVVEVSNNPLISSSQIKATN